MIDLDIALGRQDPYAGFDLGRYPIGLTYPQGSADHCLDLTIQALSPKVIIEVGSWVGGSAIYMAKILQRMAIPGRIICVDTWLGSPEHWLQDVFRGALGLEFGYPTLYHHFLGNVISNGVKDYITPLPNTSENAAHILASLGVKADMIFIDAAHEYEPVKRDLNLYWDLLTDDGVLIGDDYEAWPEVTLAADDFARERGLILTGRLAKFAIAKGSRFPNGVPLD